MEETQPQNRQGREAMAQWQLEIQKNIYTTDLDLVHSIRYYFPKDFTRLHPLLEKFGAEVPTRLEAAVAENNERWNLPRIEPYNAIGERIDKIVHHPSYSEAGDIIYGTKLLENVARPGGLSEGLSYFFLSSQAGEAGHNCPIACSSGIIRVLHKVPDFPGKAFFLQKLIAPSYRENYTGAQFLTEIQGGSDVGLNAAYAKQDGDEWRVYGEKWFCSNANAELILMTARFDNNIPGTKGLGLFLVPAVWKDKKNHYSPRRLKEKLGTRTLATAEIDFNGAYAIPMGDPRDGFKLVMENVLHLSRIFNAFSAVSSARRAHTIAQAYAKHRIAFGHPIIDYPLVKENLGRIKVENTALMAGVFATSAMQDQMDTGLLAGDAAKLTLRLLVNIQKYLTAKWSVEHVHHCLDVLAGNGTIETFSAIPRLFRDIIISENWEGTHNTLMMQVLRDMEKYDVDKLYLAYMRAEVAKLKHENARVIADSLDRLEQELKAFRKSDPAVQALRIRVIVDRFAILFAALRLLFEAVDQQATAKSSSKMDCFTHFCKLAIDSDVKTQGVFV